MALLSSSSSEDRCIEIMTFCFVVFSAPASGCASGRITRDCIEYILFSDGLRSFFNTGRALAESN